jgi:hypothetical protein
VIPRVEPARGLGEPQLDPVSARRVLPHAVRARPGGRRAGVEALSVFFEDGGQARHGARIALFKLAASL